MPRLYLTGFGPTGRPVRAFLVLRRPPGKTRRETRAAFERAASRWLARLRRQGFRVRRTRKGG